PIFMLLNKDFLKRRVDRLLGRINTVSGYILPVLLITCAEFFNTFHPETFGRRDFGGWGLLTYLTVFLCGYVLMSHPGYRQRLVAARRGFLGLGIALFVLGYALFQNGYDGQEGLFSLVRGMNMWAWLSAMFGYAGTYGKRSNKFLAVTHPMVMPVYILHQTIIVMLGYCLAGTVMPVMVKMGILFSGALALVVLCYVVAITPSRVMRILFGMKRANDLRHTQTA
ncbi:MAG: hypothetical protein MI802_07075, partial [Desulfobacterales bacterium]|nr:hypothetical protein [Desulfobacterales bacterium]